MNRLNTFVCAAAALLLSACVSDGDYGGGYYGVGAGYGSGYYGGSYYGGYGSYGSSYCDYYSPPWGYPPDYCRYQVWYRPVFYGGLWYGGPIYYRHYAGHNYYWLHGGWRRDAWHGPRPRIDWNKHGNHYWRGEMRRGRDRDPQVATDGPRPGDGGIANTPRVNDRPGRLTREDRERRRAARRGARPGVQDGDELAGAPPPGRGAGFRNGRGGDNVGASRPAESRVTRSAPSRPNVSTPRASSRGAIARNSTSRSSAGRGSINRGSVSRGGGSRNIGRASARRGGGVRGGRGRSGD